MADEVWGKLQLAVEDAPWADEEAPSFPEGAGRRALIERRGRDAVEDAERTGDEALRHARALGHAAAAAVEDAERAREERNGNSDSNSNRNSNRNSDSNSNSNNSNSSL